MFFHKHRVRFYETDKMGVVHHSSFVKWFEDARIEFFRNLGLNYKLIEDAGFNLAVAEINGRFLEPVLFDELILIKVSIQKFNKIYMKFNYVVYNQKNEVVLKGYTKHIVVGRDLKKAKLPEEFMKKLNSLLRSGRD